MLLYKEAAQFIAPGPKVGSLQTRIFDAAKERKIKSNPKHIYALVISTLKLKPFILEIIKKSQVLKVQTKPKIPELVAVLCVHDLLFSKTGRIQSGKHPIKEALLKHKTRLQAELTKLKLKHKVTDLLDLVEEDDTPVRWFRTNLIKTTTERILKELAHLTQVDTLEELDEPGKIYHDEYIPDLFGIHPKEKLTAMQIYIDGRVIIQSRPSCFPAHMLNPIPGEGMIIDATAAPGNKTTHLASYMRNHPDSIVAFERDPKRALILRKMVNKAGGLKSIQVVHEDFTKIDPKDFPDTVGIIVDPSCSGSGIFGRAFEEDDKDKQESHDPERLRKLASFQCKIVKHALMFPKVKKVIYSTCSIHAEENEQVVVDLLADEDISSAGWRVASRENVIPTWHRRGWPQEFTSLGPEEGLRTAEGCVRAMPKIDGGIGFFAVCFEKVDIEN
ncbi:hypothetical protein BABINDRAFT_165209 [Babjeviella inositovora NRRL Y-12698]|uniref:SAM-dependent MTase RsmB/NOP-type domain-containing protein n=1 Tax=Babjeviella inositovora NRRL Y-12698 TaxID=984486 RepID=A0A1E3QVJ1_9ASCO|nr:uncharacterized protein BABINDRAFT_165209 [Babjeviella inositovora NRRL Y-12698]ODQ81678.1 hypothetical protein BABINDRAFT_165209 [Babjeviella inositovora NRRL Y-12698]